MSRKDQNFSAISSPNIPLEIRNFFMSRKNQNFSGISSPNIPLEITIFFYVAQGPKFLWNFQSKYSFRN